MTVKKCGTWLVALVLLPGAGRAQTSLTLGDAVRTTLARNPALDARRSTERETAARVDEARAGRLPRVDFSESWQRANQPVFVFGSLLAQRRFGEANFAIDALNHPPSLSDFRTALSVQQLLYDGNRTSAAVTLARVGRAVASLETRRLEADLAVETTRAFGRVLVAIAAVRSAESAVAAAEEDSARAVRRRDAGLENEANVLALRVHELRMRERRIRSRQDERQSRAELNGLMGAPLDAVFDLVADPMPPATPVSDLAQLEAEAVRQRPEIEIADRQQEGARAARTAAISGFLPEVALQATTELNGSTLGNGATAWATGVQVRWNVFSGFSDRARVAEARAAMDRSRAERARAETAVRLEVRAAFGDLESAAAREAVGRAMIAQARESQRMTRDRYEAGLASVADVLRTAMTVVDAEMLHASALAEVQTARAALHRATGRKLEGA